MMMEEKSKLLSPLFTDMFQCRFDSDLIDWDDIEDTLFNAEIVVGDMARRGANIDDIIYTIEKVFAQWGPEVFDEFISASNVPWDCDEETENMLKAIVTRMLETAQSIKGGKII